MMNITPIRSAQTILCCFVANCTLTDVSAQLVPRPGQNLWEWHNDFITDPTVSSANEGEGSSYALHEKTMQQWGPRLFPDGDFQHIGEAVQNQIAFATGGNRDEEPFVSTWLPLGPFSTPPSVYQSINHTGVGQIHKIGFAPGYGNTNTTVYCASGFGGLFKSIDDGATWQSLTDFTFAFAGVSDFHIDATSGTIFISTGGSDQALQYSTGVWRSNNDGVDWENISEDLFLSPNSQFNNIFSMEVSPTDPNIQLIATINGIYRTANAMAPAASVTWQLVFYPLGQDLAPIENYWKGLTFQYGSDQVLFASGRDVYMSTDAGVTWSSITGAGTGLDFSQAPWSTSPTADGAAIPSRINVAVSSRDPNSLHAFIDLGKNGNGSSHAFALDISTLTWQYLYRVTNDVGSYSTSPGWVALAIAPAGMPDAVFYGGQLFRRSVDGNLPTTLGSGILHDDFQEAVFSPDGTKLWIGTHGGIYRASNPYGNFVSSEWVALNNQLQVGTILGCSVNPVMSGSAFIGNQDCGTSFREPNTLGAIGDWKHLMGGDGSSNIVSPDGTRAWNWLLSPRNRYYRHTLPFNSQPSPFYVGPLGSFDENETPPLGFQPNTGRWFFGSSDLWAENDMYVSPSNSSSFTRLSGIQGDLGDYYFVDNCLTQGRSHVAIAPSNENYVYQVTGIKRPSIDCPDGNGSRLFRSRRDVNGIIIPEAASEPQLEFANLPPLFASNPRAITGIAVDPSVPERLWITFSGYLPALRVWMSEDEGNTWIDADPELSLPNLPINDIIYQVGTNDGLYVAMDVGVYYKNASMSSWAPFFGTLPNVQVNDLDINYCDGKIIAGTYGRGLWESDLAEQPTVEMVIDQDRTWDFHRNLAQSVRIRSGNTLTITSTANFAPNTSLIVEPGAVLIVDGGTLTNSCGGSWDGIQVWGDGLQHQFGTTPSTMYSESPYQGHVELRNEWTIANARVAILMEQPGVLNTSGGFVIARDGEFRNCGRAVEFKEYRNFHPTASTLTRQNRSRFYNTKFIIDDFYTVDVPFQEHVKLTKVNGIYFHGCNFENTRLNVTESHVLGYGIYSIDANYTVGPKCFGYLPGNIYQPCPEIWLVPSEFIGLDHGIHALNGDDARSYHVEHTTFMNNVCGIYSEGVVGFKVLNCNFEVGGNPVTTLTGLVDESFLNHHRALFTTGGYGFLIEDNQLHKVGAAPSEGIVVGYSGGHNDMVFHNSAHNLDAAYIGEGICADVAARAYIGLNFQCNTNDDNQRNLWSRFVPSDPLSAADQTIRTNQGRLERAGDNAFDRDDMNLDIDNTNNLTNVLTYWWQAPASPFQPFYNSDGVIVTDNYNSLPVLRPEGNCASRNVLLTAYPTTNPGPISDGMMIDGTNYTNSAYLHKQLIDGGNTDQMVEEVIESWPEEVWALRSYLLEKSPYLSVDVLKEMVNKPFLPVAIKAEICIANPDATKKEGFVKWLRYEAGTPMPESLIDNIEASWDTKTFRTQLESTMAHHHGEMTQKAHLLMNYFTSDTLDHTDSLRWVWQQIRTPAARYAEALTYMQEGNYDAARGVIEDLPEEHDLKAKEESERYRMLAFIDFLSPIHGSGRNNSQLTVAEQNALEGIIANQRDRPATWAQNILCFYYGKCRGPLTGGDGGTPKSRRVSDSSLPVSSGPSLRMYPNPASNYVVFEVDLATEPHQAAITIMDIAGRAVKRLYIANREQQLVFDSRELAPGAYTIRLSNNGITSETKNLIIRQ